MTLLFARAELVQASDSATTVIYESPQLNILQTAWLLVRKSNIPTERSPLVGEF
jgi:hypothetical protein